MGSAIDAECFGALELALERLSTKSTLATKNDKPKKLHQEAISRFTQTRFCLDFPVSSSDNMMEYHKKYCIFRIV